MVTFPMTLTDL